MKPVKWWVAVLVTLLALAFGFIPYALITAAAKMPLALRDRPWPLELGAVVLAMAAIVLAVRAVRTKTARIVAIFGAVLATLNAALFLFAVHVATYMIPPAPTALGVGTIAPDFTLRDDTGNEVSLASQRGHGALLVFYRGYW